LQFVDEVMDLPTWLEEKVAATAISRRERRQALDRVTVEGWDFLPVPEDGHFTLARAASSYLELRYPEDSQLQLFFRLLPLELLLRVRDNIDPAVLYRGRTEGSGRVDPNDADIIKVLAAYIFLMGEQNHFDAETDGKTDLQKGMNMAKDFFEQGDQARKFPCKNKWDKFSEIITSLRFITTKSPQTCLPPSFCLDVAWLVTKTCSTLLATVYTFARWLINLIGLDFALANCVDCCWVALLT
jgi:hypothetical protein